MSLCVHNMELKRVVRQALGHKRHYCYEASCFKINVLVLIYQFMAI